MTTGLGAEICRRIDELAAITAEPGKLTRVFLSPEQKRASDLVLSWMREAGMTAGIDAIGNVVGRYEADGSANGRPGAPALVLGSHLDTVRDAGRYDGMLGVVTAISCVADLHRRGRRLPFAIEVIGFADEEGVRFHATLLGSRAVAGTFDPALLDSRDDDGVSMAEAMLKAGLDPAAIGTAAHRPEDVLAYVELHIEQGPVLERKGLPVGCVTSINGATRLKVEVAGEAGHAGTVPMQGRRDAVCAAADCILAVERRCGAEDGLVGTVGLLEVVSGAVNVVPGLVRFAIDIRAPDDGQRQRAVADVLREVEAIGRRRGVTITAKPSHEGKAAPCAPWLMDQVDGAIAAEGIAPFRLPSGAGHDGMAVADIADIGMIFVRCAGGISHNPAESITVEDADIGARVLTRFIENFQDRRGS